MPQPTERPEREALKPCPFCGGAADPHMTEMGRVIQCGLCDAMIPQEDRSNGCARDAAVWNRRAAEDTLRGTLHELVRDLVLSAIRMEPLEGGDVQERAVAAGLLVPTEMREPCGDNCACADVTDFPTTCYRFNSAALAQGERDDPWQTHKPESDGYV